MLTRNHQETLQAPLKACREDALLRYGSEGFPWHRLPPLKEQAESEHYHTDILTFKIRILTDNLSYDTILVPSGCPRWPDAAIAYILKLILAAGQKETHYFMTRA